MIRFYLHFLDVSSCNILIKGIIYIASIEIEAIICFIKNKIAIFPVFLDFTSSPLPSLF